MQGKYHKKIRRIMILCKNRFFGIRTPRSTLPAKQSVRSRTTFKPSFLKVFILGLNVSGKFSGSLELSIAVTLVARIGLIWKPQSEFNVWISAMLYITVSLVTFLFRDGVWFVVGLTNPAKPKWSLMCWPRIRSNLSDSITKFFCRAHQSSNELRLGLT